VPCSFPCSWGPFEGQVPNPGGVFWGGLPARTPGRPPPLQPLTPLLGPIIKDALFHRKLPETGPNRTAQTGASCPKSPEPGDFAPGREFNFDEDAKSRRGPPVSPTPGGPRSPPSPTSPSHHALGLIRAHQRARASSALPSHRAGGFAAKGRRLRSSPRASGDVFYSVVGGIFQRWLLGPVPLQLQLYSPFQRQRRQTVSTPLPFRACQKRGDRQPPGTGTRTHWGGEGL